MSVTTLVPGVSVWEYDGRSDVVDRLVRLFRETWRCVPASARRRLRRYWRRHGGGPRVELMSYWSGYEPGISAQVGLLGHQVRFHTPFIELSNEADVRFIIAHELAHVLQWATGAEHCNVRRIEREANATARAWLGVSRRPRATRAYRGYVLAEHLRQMRARRVGLSVAGGV